MERVITGLHGIEEAVRSGKNKGVLYISRKNSRINNIINNAGSRIRVENLSPADMNRRFGEDNRGVVLELYTSAGETASFGKGRSEGKSGRHGGVEQLFEDVVDRIASDNALILILDGITDPHNYGAILRSADQFSADLVVIPARRSVSETDTVAKTSAGAVNYVPVSVVTNLSRSIDYLKEHGFWVYGADMATQSINKTDFKGRVAIVMGSEGKGISRLCADKCDALVSIPASGNIDSLNVSVAAGIIMYEVRRQQA